MLIFFFNLGYRFAFTFLIFDVFYDVIHYGGVAELCSVILGCSLPPVRETWVRVWAGAGGLEVRVLAGASYICNSKYKQ